MEQVEDSFGNVYRGELLNGKRNGHGTLVYAETRDIFQGDFENDVPHGRGKYFRFGSHGFEGLWENGSLTQVKSGQATLVEKNGDKYKGTFENWKRHGVGKLIKSNGERYLGEFKDGLRHGTGTIYFADGSQYKGIFRKDKPVTDSDKVVDEASQFDQFTVDLNSYSPRSVEHSRTPLSPLNNPIRSLTNPAIQTNPLNSEQIIARYGIQRDSSPAVNNSKSVESKELIMNVRERDVQKLAQRLNKGNHGLLSPDDVLGAAIEIERRRGEIERKRKMETAKKIEMLDIVENNAKEHFQFQPENRHLINAQSQFEKKRNKEKKDLQRKTKQLELEAAAQSRKFRISDDGTNLEKDIMSISIDCHDLGKPPQKDDNFSQKTGIKSEGFLKSFFRKGLRGRSASPNKLRSKAVDSRAASKTRRRTTGESLETISIKEKRSMEQRQQKAFTEQSIEVKKAGKKKSPKIASQKIFNFSDIKGRSQSPATLRSPKSQNNMISPEASLPADSQTRMQMRGRPPANARSFSSNNETFRDDNTNTALIHHDIDKTSSQHSFHADTSSTMDRPQILQKHSMNNSVKHARSREEQPVGSQVQKRFDSQLSSNSSDIHNIDNNAIRLRQLSGDSQIQHVSDRHNPRYTEENTMPRVSERERIHQYQYSMPSQHEKNQMQQRSPSPHQRLTQDIPQGNGYDNPTQKRAPNLRQRIPQLQNSYPQKLQYSYSQDSKRLIKNNGKREESREQRSESPLVQQTTGSSEQRQLDDRPPIRSASSNEQPLRSNGNIDMIATSSVSSMDTKKHKEILKQMRSSKNNELSQNRSPSPQVQQRSITPDGRSRYYSRPQDSNNLSVGSSRHSHMPPNHRRPPSPQLQQQHQNAISPNDNKVPQIPRSISVVSDDIQKEKSSQHHPINSHMVEQRLSNPHQMHLNENGLLQQKANSSSYVDKSRRTPRPLPHGYQLQVESSNQHRSASPQIQQRLQTSSHSSRQAEKNQIQRAPSPLEKRSTSSYVERRHPHDDLPNPSNVSLRSASSHECKLNRRRSTRSPSPTRFRNREVDTNKSSHHYQDAKFAQKQNSWRRSGSRNGNFFPQN